MASGSLLRIGELSKRTGVSAELLRAWERRYELLRPTRSAGGLRLYSPGVLVLTGDPIAEAARVSALDPVAVDPAPDRPEAVR